MKLNDSIDTVKKLRSEGLTYRLIGEHLKLSKQRVYQIIQAGRSVIWSDLSGPSDSAFVTPS
jgi:DNA invertase Pin-like site-specific DNA recombinase